MPKFNGKNNEFAMWSAKAKSNLVMKFLGPTLLVSYNDSLPVNEQVKFDKSSKDSSNASKIKGRA
jgi:hypothetical protein